MEVALTTTDNPFDPFEEFDLWYHFDQTKGYKTAELAARLYKISSSFPDKTNNILMEFVFEEFLKDNPTGLHKLVYRKGGGEP